MLEKFFGGLDFGTSGARISINDSNRDLVYTSSVIYKYQFSSPLSWSSSCQELLNNLPDELKKEENEKQLILEFGEKNERTSW